MVEMDEVENQVNNAHSYDTQIAQEVTDSDSWIALALIMYDKI